MSYDPSANPNLVQPVVPEQDEHQQRVDDSAKIEIAYVDDSQHQATNTTESTPPTDATNETDSELVASDSSTDSNVITEEQIGSNYIRNKDKAEEMAHAQNDAIDAGKDFPQNAALHAGIDYDMNIARRKESDPEHNQAEKQETLEKLRVFNLKRRNQILRYSNAIVEHYKQTSDTPSPSLEALAAVHQLVQNTGSEIFDVDTGGDFLAPDFVKVSLNNHDNVVVETGDEQKNKYEKFELSMFYGARYEVVEEDRTGSIDGNYHEVYTIKRRYLEQEDVKRLREVLAPAIAYQAEQDRINDERDQDETDDRFDEDPEYDYYDDSVSPQEILSRAQRVFGNTEHARDMARDFPGDFM